MGALSHYSNSKMNDEEKHLFLFLWSFKPPWVLNDEYTNAIYWKEITNTKRMFDFILFNWRDFAYWPRKIKPEIELRQFSNVYDLSTYVQFIFMPILLYTVNMIKWYCMLWTHTTHMSNAHREHLCMWYFIEITILSHNSDLIRSPFVLSYKLIVLFCFFEIPAWNSTAAHTEIFRSSAIIHSFRCE